jgi:hypothetical protein
MNAVAPGRSDDFNEQPTQHAKYGMGGSPPPAAEPTPLPTADSGPIPPPPSPPAPEQFEEPEFLDPLDEDAEFTPWYRKPVMLIGWGLFVAILIGVIVYGILQLIHGNDATTDNPPTSTPFSTSPSTATTSATPSPSTAIATTPTTAPPTSSAIQPPAHQPTQQQPTQQQPTHRHHLPQLPSVITIPEVPTVITVPPELR